MGNWLKDTGAASIGTYFVAKFTYSYKAFSNEDFSYIKNNQSKMQCLWRRTMEVLVNSLTSNLLTTM